MIKCINAAYINGIVSTAPRFYGLYNNQKTYEMFVDVKRLSDTVDHIPVEILDSTFDISKIKEGDVIDVFGKVISFYKHKGANERHLIVRIIAETINIKPAGAIPYYINDIRLSGFILNKSQIRKTPMGKTIQDFIFLGIDENYKLQRIHIPCIAWEKTAYQINAHQINKLFTISARFQSRKYVKRWTDGTEEEKETYELSVMNINP